MSEPSSSPTGAQISRLVGEIYDCVLAPEKWHAAVDAIRAEFNFANAIVTTIALPAGEPVLGVVAGVSPSWLARIGDYNDDVVSLWGGPAQIAQFPLEEPIIQSQVFDANRWMLNRYYREWIQPQGIIDAAAIGLERNSTRVANVAFGRHGSAGPIRDVEITGLRLLAPHLRRAVTIGQFVASKSVEASAFASALETYRAGVIMVDVSMRVLHTNKAADAMLAAGDLLRIRNNRLGLTDGVAERSLQAAVFQSATDEALLGRRSGMGIAIRRGGKACIVHVLPLIRRKLLPNVAPQAVVALFITEAGQPYIPLPSMAMETLYDLTPAELRVFESLVEGRSQAETAIRLGIAASTLKTHLLRVYEKTGAKRQADLVRLASSLASPV